MYNMKQPSKKPTGTTSGAKGQLPKADQPELDDTDIPTHPPEFKDDNAEPELENDIPLDDEVSLEIPQTPNEATPPAPVPPPAPANPLEKVDKEKLLGFIESIIGTLTFKTVALVALLIAISLILFSVYENRSGIVTKITAPAPVNVTTPEVTSWVLSEKSKQSLIALAKATNVAMIIIADVDLKKNRRTVRYYYIDDPALKLEPGAVQALGLPLPVFDYDTKNTEQMVAILSNDFRCDPYKDTAYFRYAPELASKFPTLCRLAIPPFVGQFVGFLAIGISGEPSKSELETIRLEVSRIAIEIYLNDVTGKKTTDTVK